MLLSFTHWFFGDTPVCTDHALVSQTKLIVAPFGLSLMSRICTLLQFFHKYIFYCCP